MDHRAIAWGLDWWCNWWFDRWFDILQPDIVWNRIDNAFDDFSFYESLEQLITYRTTILVEYNLCTTTCLIYIFSTYADNIIYIYIFCSWSFIIMWILIILACLAKWHEYRELSLSALWIDAPFISVKILYRGASLSLSMLHHWNEMKRSPKALPEATLLQRWSILSFMTTLLNHDMEKADSLIISFYIFRNNSIQLCYQKNRWRFIKCCWYLWETEKLRHWETETRRHCETKTMRHWNTELYWNWNWNSTEV